MKNRHPQKELPTRTWQMSFNDLLTVLLTFFILLVSASSIQINKVQDLSVSAAGAFGSRVNEDQKDGLIRTIGAMGGINAYPVSGGVSLILPEALVYRSGSADILHQDLLKQLGQKLKAAAGSIRVEGHTDSIPIAGGAFPSNWELSTQRSVNVVKFLAAECGIDPAKLSAAGYADSKPMASNESPEGRSLNRRVNMIISFK
jgi:chemotaxis protein MotB